MRTALSIDGRDSSGGAGIQADLKTMTMNGVFAMSAITALTAQNTTGVTGIMEVTPDFLQQQIDAVFEDIYPDAVKIGMVSSSALIEKIAERLQFYGAKNIVVDPVMVATSGSRLIAEFYIKKAPLKAGVKEALEYFAENQVKMCIATATDKDLVEKALIRCGVREYFTEILTCGEVGHGKDEPVIYEKALEILGTTKENTLVFEDAIHAIGTAKEEGFMVAGVFDESEVKQEKVVELSDLYLRTFEDIYIPNPNMSL